MRRLLIPLFLVSALFAGYEATSFEEEGERYDVRVQVRPEYRDDLSKLDLVHVRGPGGALVPLRNLVTPRIGSGPVQIDRADRTRAITVYGNLEGKSAGEAGVEVMAFGEELGEPLARIVEESGNRRPKHDAEEDDRQHVALSRLGDDVLGHDVQE